MPTPTQAPPAAAKSELRAGCPHCAAVFLLTEAQMEAREGLVRCGACRQIFNAKWHLQEEVVVAAGDGPGGESAAGREPAAPVLGDAEVAGDEAVGRGRRNNYWQRLAPKLTPLPGPAPSPADDFGDGGGIGDRDEFHEPAADIDTGDTDDDRQPPGRQVDFNGVDHYLQRRANPLANIVWSLAALVFLVLLGAQVKYLFVDQCAQDELFRPYLAAFCVVAGCELPPRHDPQRFTLTRTQIDLHPRQPGAMRVAVKLVNEATFAQPYPRLRLTLTDRDGRVVGRRAFSPDQYLRGAPNLLHPGELGAIFLDLARPHEKAVGFEIEVVGAVES